jgi:two-component system sensor histidine kinase KdpD
MKKCKDQSYNIRFYILQISITLGLNILTTLLLLLLQHFGFTEVNIVVLYILSVLITSRYTKGYIYGIIASILSMLTFNFFFTEPIFTFKVYDNSYIFTFMVMLLSSFFTSTLASKLIYSKDLASEREKQSHTLYQIASSLAKTSDIQEIANVSIQLLSNLFEYNIFGFLTNSRDGNALMLEIDTEDSNIITKNIDFNIIHSTISNYFTIPIKLSDTEMFYLCFPKEFEGMSDLNKFLLNSIIMQIYSSVERVYLIREKEAAKSETERERFKNNLLRAISHDLRTPLARIRGAAEILSHNLDENSYKQLVSGIYEDSTWLTRLVENILGLTRIQEGSLSLSLQLEAVEEIISEAIHRSTKYFPDRLIKITVPDEVLFVPMDGKLIVQVLINLISNAIEHTTEDEDITISVWQESDRVWFEVSDKGTGIRDLELPRIFDMFYVSNKSRTDGKQGMGLGLAICKAIVNYHDGEIYATNNKDGGATFRFYLKKQEDK